MKYQQDLEKAEKNAEFNRKWLYSHVNDPALDNSFHQNHKHVFEEVDCLQCANCCKTTSPIILQEDMDRIAQHLEMTTAEFIQRYLEMDEDGDFVFTQTPCPFLKDDNYCQVYEVRPKACAEYPHTNRKNMAEIADLTLKNSLVCPAVSRVFDQLREHHKD